jgi:hypothetical protein
MLNNDKYINFRFGGYIPLLMVQGCVKLEKSTYSYSTISLPCYCTPSFPLNTEHNLKETEQIYRYGTFLPFRSSSVVLYSKN